MRRTNPLLASSYSPKLYSDIGSENRAVQGCYIVGNALLMRLLTAYYFGHGTKCNFFFPISIGAFHFVSFEAVGMDIVTVVLCISRLAIYLRWPTHNRVTKKILLSSSVVAR